MNELKDVLQISANLYVMLADLQKVEDRMGFIDDINEKLDVRNEKIQLLKDRGFQYNQNEKSHITLLELDKGLQTRLKILMDAIKDDLKDLQNAKKNEKQYFNPYSDLQTMDGMYYDKKK